MTQRSKEEANDYRYFPEPDLPPLRPSEEWVSRIRAAMPELPAARRARYVEGLGLSAYDADVLTADLALANYFDAVVAARIAPKTAANWVTGEFSRLLNQHAAEGLRASAVALRPEGLAELISAVEGREVSAANAKAVLAEVFESGDSPKAVVGRLGLQQVGDAESIGAEVEAVIAEFPGQVADYRSGKAALFGFLVGQVMKRTAGRADARLVNDELRRRLEG
jgi:aspartyl-tRNA(Asn)/glutamyl-tRNA(Gln) amidotransferase subunit B